MLYGEILMPRFPLSHLKGAASRNEMSPNRLTIQPEDTLEDREERLVIPRQGWQRSHDRAPA